MCSLSPEPATMMNARCTTTSAPSHRRWTDARSSTSPCRYSTLRQPCVAGSKGRRAMPTILSTSRERSSVRMNGLPISPVGPVTATVSPTSAPPPGELALGDAPEPADLAPVDPHPLDHRPRRQLEPADQLVRRQRPAAVVLLDEVAPDLEVLLPCEPLVVGVRGEAREPRLERGTRRDAADVDEALLGVRAHRDADREREPVGAHERQHGGVVAGAELVHPLVPRGVAALRVGVPVLGFLVVAGAHLLDVRVEQLGLG